jgi:hypothetical protein
MHVQIWVDGEPASHPAHPGAPRAPPLPPPARRRTAPAADAPLCAPPPQRSSPPPEQVDFSFSLSPDPSPKASGCGAATSNQTQHNKLPRTFKEVLLSMPARDACPAGDGSCSVPRPEFYDGNHARKTPTSTAVPVRAGGTRATSRAAARLRLKSIIVVPKEGNYQATFPTIPRGPVAARLSFPATTPVPPPAGGRRGMDAQGWEAYRSKRQRKEEARQRTTPRRVSVFRRLGHASPATKPFHTLFLERTAGRCFKCLAPDHKVHQCRDPPRCISCFRSGHRARYCKTPPAPPPPPPPPSPQPKLRPQSTPHLPPPFPLAAVPPAVIAGQQPTMPSFPVDLAHRPSITLACAPATPEILDRACDLQERAVVLVGEGEQPSCAEVAWALGLALGHWPGSAASQHLAIRSRLFHR